MNASIDLSSIAAPTVIDISAPQCAACRAMRPDVEAVAAAFAGRIDHVRLDASTDFDAVRRLGVMGTPTLIGVRDGDVLFRVTGRRSRDEFTELFGAVEAGVEPARMSRTDTGIRIGGGVALAIAGLLAGPAWPLLVGGVAMAGYGLATIVLRK